MAWDDPLAELRSILNDDVTGFVVKSKPVFPSKTTELRGQIRQYPTLEMRLTTSGYQHTQPTPLRLFLENKQSGVTSEYPASGILVTNALRGEFEVMAAPSGVVLTAGYSWREWDDTDLTRYLQQGVKQCNGDATQPQNLIEGLQMVALYFAAEQAHRRAAHRWQQRLGEQWLLEDAAATTEAQKVHIDFHMQQATEMHRLAVEMRDAYFKDLLGAVNRPAGRMLVRVPRPYTPRR